MSPSSHSRNLRGRTLAVIATVAVVSGGALGYRQVTGGGGEPPAAGEANIWIDGNGGNCVRHATPVTYDDGGNADSCAVSTLNGFTSGMSGINTNGGKVQFAPGTYSINIARPFATSRPTVTIEGDPNMPDQYTCASNECAQGAVVASGLQECGPNMTIRDFDTNTGTAGGPYMGFALQSCSGTTVVDNHDITAYNIHTGRISVLGTNMSIEHSRFGPIFNECDITPDHDGDLIHLWNGNSGAGEVRSINVTVDHSVIWWNQNDYGSCNSDSDTMQVAGVDNLTFTNNIIGACTSQNWTEGAVFGNSSEDGTILIANNFFNGFATPTANCVGTQFGFGPYTCTANWIVQYNTFLGNKATFSGCGERFTIRNNYFENEPNASNTCAWGTWDYNVFGNGSSSTCGTNATRCDPSFSSSNLSLDEITSWDEHLASNDTCLNQHGSPTVYQATDIDGDTRSSGDVGADVVP